ncbi:MAG: Mu-like prophage major head subunit gpT family protein [Sulfurospirillum sp.]|nr:Mu-like prophage major head subunit gpT family protein [Sulfurospirillum sp.]
MAHFEETSIGFKSIFQKTYNDTTSEAKRLATEIKSNDLSEKYTWLGNFPNMKEWIGDRDVKVLSDFGYTLENKLYEASVTVPNIHIEYDKVGLYKPAIEQMALNAKLFPSELVADVLINGHTNLCYDGKAFFAADHITGTDTYANMGAGELNTANVLAGMNFMESIKNANGKTLRIKPTMLVCGPTNRSAAIQTLEKEFKAGGESNETYKMVEYMVLPEITGSEWFLLDISKPLKPFIAQVAKDGIFEASNDDKFMKDHALFGVKSFMNAGYGLWQLAYRFSGTAL